MSRSVLVLLVAEALLLIGPQLASAQPGCSVTAGVAPQSRRAEALRAAGMFNTAAAAMRGPLVLPRRPNSQAPPYPSWGELAYSSLIATWRTDGGPIGELARKVRWGEDEPLPGWRIHWVANYDGYAFTLTDMRDRCGFTYFSDDRGAIGQGINAGPSVSVIPAETQ